MGDKMSEKTINKTVENIMSDGPGKVTRKGLNAAESKKSKINIVKNIQG